MGVLKQLFNFGASGLDYDSDPSLVAPGDSTNRVNVSTGEHGREFVISNMKGTTKKSHSFDHDGAYDEAGYTVIGSLYDDNRDAIYIFIYSDLSNHCILRFNYSDDSFDKIAWDHTGLGFDVDYPIVDPFMIGDFLHWNPRTTSPRVINVQWAYWDFVADEFTLAVSDTTEWSIGDYVKENNKVYKILVSGIDRDDVLTQQPQSVEFIDWTYQDVDTYPDSVDYGTYKAYRSFYNNPVVPYSSAPFTSLEEDTDYNANYIRGNVFQFAYRFFVPGQGFTISSSFSPIISNPNDEALDGEVLEDVTVNNLIEVGFTVGNTSGYGPFNNRNWLWEFVEIIFRKNDESTWRLAERINHDDAYGNSVRYDVATATFKCSTLFYNDKSYETIDSAAVEKQYNALPVLARSQWSLDGERSAYGGITEGLGLPDGLLLIELTSANRPIGLLGGSYPTASTPEISFSITDKSPVTGGFEYEYTSDSITTLPSGVGPWKIRFSLYGQAYEGEYTPATGTAYRANVLEVMNQSGVSAYDNGSNRLVFKINTPWTPTVTAYVVSGITGVSVTKVNSFKTNAEHAFCQFYFDDAGRRSDPVTQSNQYTYGTSIFIPSLPDEGVLTEGTNHQQYVNWEIGHDAPSWATHWKWGYAGNQSIDQFWQYNIESIVIGTGGLAGYACIDISGLQSIADDTAGNDNVHINSNIGSYVFEEGDRVKFITQHDGAITDTTALALANPGYDYEIKGYDDVLNLIYIDADGADGSASSYADYSGLETVIEIYRPNKEPGNLEYYEIGSMYEVYESGGRYFHRGASQDQTASVTATGEHSVGDVYLKTRQVANDPPSFTTSGDPIFVESYHWSDFYDSDTWGKGKLGIISGIGQKYLNNVRYGNKYSPNTLSSGVSEFDGLDYASLSNENGKITAMRQAGHVLKVYFERNSASVMVNKAQFLDADGVSQIVKSDDVLGTIEYSNYNYGTIFPESVILIDRTVYFYDIYRKAYLRDSSNGLFAISDYKAVKKFAEISEALLTSGVENVQVWTGYDSDRKFLYVMVKDSGTPANDVVIVFNEKKNKWECTVELTAGSLLRRTSRDLISFISEDLYIHNDNTNRNYFYTETKTSSLDIIANLNPEIMKVLDSITLNSNDGEWIVTDIVIPPTAQYPRGMYSKIPNEIFTKREGGMHAEFLRNMKTSTSSESLLELRSGEPLRGQTATITLENSETSEVVLFDVVVNMSASKI